MAITSAGIGSNLDVEGIVTKLMSVEQRPLTALSTKEAGYQAKISALGSLKGALSALQSAASALIPDTGSSAFDKFSVFTATSTHTEVVTANASSSAVAGTYSLEVTQLAQQHRIATATGASSPFDSSNQLIGEGGTLTITLNTPGESNPTKTTALSIADGATPETIRDAVNAAKAGVSATVINGVNGKQLVLVSDTPGSDQAIKLSGIAELSYDGAGGDADEFTELQAAQGAAFKLNGVTVTTSTNTVTTAIDGITLSLIDKSEVGKPATITVARENSSLTAGINALVKAYNDFNTTANSLGSYNTTTKVAGLLNGDSTLRAAQSILRSAISNAPAGLTDASMQRLSDIGVSMQKDGSLAVNSTKLTAAINSNLTGVADLVAAYGNKFKTATDGLIGTSGSITTRTEGIQTSIKGLGKQSEAIVLRLKNIEARYRKQFTDLDVMMSNMNQTSTYLTQQLANLPKSGSISNSN